MDLRPVELLWREAADSPDGARADGAPADRQLPDDVPLRGAPADGAPAGRPLTDNAPLRDAPTVVLAHGAGAAMDSSWMNDFCARLAVRGVRTARFEFGYMAARRDGVRRPAPRAETVVGEYRDAVAAVIDVVGAPVVIGGKSFGGRVASLAADELHADGLAAGLVCLGYPFHPPQKPAQLRTAHLAELRTPTLICQGTRDPLGTREEVAGYVLSDAIEMLWLEDGEHDFRPRVKISGFRLADHLDTAADAVATHATKWCAKAQNH